MAVTERESPKPPPRPLLLIALGVVCLFAAARYHDKISRPARDGTFSKSAFLRWRTQVLDLKAGHDIYAKYNYPNPPVQALILLPFYSVEPVAGALLWFAVKAGMALLSWVWARRLTAGTPHPRPTAAFLTAGLLTLHPVLGDLSHGNVNIFIAFLVVGSLEALRRRYDFAAGAVLALAIACKVTPALFLPYFVWKRLWRASLGCLVGLAVWLYAVPGAALGFDRTADLTVSWFDTMVRPFLLDGKVNGEHANQSLTGLIARLLTNSPSDYDYDEGDGQPVAKEFHNVADIGPVAAKRLTQGCQLAYAVLGAWLLRTRLDRPGDPRAGLAVAAEYAFVVLGMLLFSERTWKHHGVVLMLPFIVVSCFYFTQTLRLWVKALLSAANATLFLLVLVPSLVGGDFQDTALAYGSHTALFLILLAQVTLVLAWGRLGWLAPGQRPAAH